MNIADKENLSATVSSVVELKMKSSLDEVTFEYCEELNNHNRKSSSMDNTFELLQSDPSDRREYNFLAFLGRDFAKHPFVLAYKEKIVSVSEDHILFSPDNEKKKIVKEPQKTEKNNSDSDLWGSPLKCNFPSDDSSIDIVSLESSHMRISQETYKPKRLGIPVSTARKLISVYNLKQTELESSEGQKVHPAFLVLCNGADLKCTSLIGSKMLQVSFDNMAKKAIKITTISLGKRERDAQQMLTSASCQWCQAVYQVTIPVEEGEEEWGKVAVELKWKGARYLLETPPADASASINASVRSGSVRSSMYKLFLELSFLKKIISAVCKGEVEWACEDSELPVVPLVLAVKKLMETMLEEGSLTHADTLENRDAEEMLPFLSASKSMSISQRSDYDFTDRLWMVLLDCKSTADLMLSLRLVFTALGCGHLQPFVDRQNQTTIAQMVREAFTGRFSAPSLTGSQPFLFLAEIGVEKLRRDYIHIFVSHHLASSSSLQGLLGAEGELLSRVKGLEMAHVVLEMVSLLTWSLQLSPSSLSLLTRQMLAHYQHHPWESNDIFSFAIKTSEVQSVVCSTEPVMWSVEIEIPVALYDLHESHLWCLCAEQPFLHLREVFKDAISTCETEKKEQVKNNSKNGSVQYCLVHRQEKIVVL